MDKTVVVFRKWKDGGDIIALFPYEYDEPRANYNCLSYEHVGQHSDAWYEHVIKVTVPASELEYNDLLEELTSIGYNLIVRKRKQNKFTKT